LLVIFLRLHAAKVREAAGPMVSRILPKKFRAKARPEGPSGKRALRRNTDPRWKRVFLPLFSSDYAILLPLVKRDNWEVPGRSLVIGWVRD
jgi:hypothetical protein